MAEKDNQGTREEEEKNEDNELLNGEQLLENRKKNLKEEETFIFKKGKEFRTPFRHNHTIGKIKENKEWRIMPDDGRYGIFRDDADDSCLSEPNSETSEESDIEIQVEEKSTMKEKEKNEEEMKKEHKKSKRVERIRRVVKCLCCCCCPW